MSADGRRCAERAFLEFHHVRPYAVGGRPTVENIRLRCGPHNRFAAREYFGAGLAARTKFLPLAGVRRAPCEPFRNGLHRAEPTSQASSASQALESGF